MKNKLLSHILMVATILTSYTVGTMQPTQTVNASTPKQISVTNAIPICDIAGYFYDKYGYLCFELGDTTKQFNSENHGKNITGQSGIMGRIILCDYYRMHSERCIISYGNLPR